MIKAKSANKNTNKNTNNRHTRKNKCRSKGYNSTKIQNKDTNEKEKITTNIQQHKNPIEQAHKRKIPGEK